MIERILSQWIEIKDIGELKYFLVIEVARFKQDLFIFQLNYDLNLIEK